MTPRRISNGARRRNAASTGCRWRPNSNTRPAPALRTPSSLGPGSADGQANYDPKRPYFAEWRTHLKPVKSYPPNAFKLYDMAGNVWQMVATDPDYAEQRYIYRIEDPIQKQGTVAGGSWARTVDYMRVSARGGASAGIRHPTSGSAWCASPKARPRSSASRGASSPPTWARRSLYRLAVASRRRVRHGFHVYRSARRDAAGERITPAPVEDSTNFVDPSAPTSGRIFYRVRALSAAGKEGPPSEWAALTIGPIAAG